MTGGRLLCGAAVAVALLVAAPAAAADDASLFSAYNARQGHAFREVRWWRRGNNFENQAIRGLLRGHSAQMRRLYRRANRTMRRCYRQGRSAVRHFKAVGLTSPAGAISW